MIWILRRLPLFYKKIFYKQFFIYMSGAFFQTRNLHWLKKCYWNLRFQWYFIRQKLPKAITLVVRQISLRSNITRRRRIKLPKCPKGHLGYSCSNFYIVIFCAFSTECYFPFGKCYWNLTVSVIFYSPKTAEGNNTCRKTNITAKQYNSP